MVLLFFVLAILMFGYEKIVGFERKPKKVMKSAPIKETPVSIDRKNFIFEDEDTNESSFQIINADPVKPVQPDVVDEEKEMDDDGSDGACTYDDVWNYSICVRKRGRGRSNRGYMAGCLRTDQDSSQ